MELYYGMLSQIATALKKKGLGNKNMHGVQEGKTSKYCTNNQYSQVWRIPSNSYYLKI